LAGAANRLAALVAFEDNRSFDCAAKILAVRF
jgi:hypothetical protein